MSCEHSIANSGHGVLVDSNLNVTIWKLTEFRGIKSIFDVIAMLLAVYKAAAIWKENYGLRYEMAQISLAKCIPLGFEWV